MKRLAEVAKAHGFSIKTPVGELSKENLAKVLYGTGNQKYEVQLGMDECMNRPTKRYP